MKSRILAAAAAASLAFAAAAFAQTGVSGQPGIPTALTTTLDASASPTPYTPPPPPSAPPATSGTPGEPAAPPSSPFIPPHPAPRPATPHASPAPPPAATAPEGEVAPSAPATPEPPPERPPEPAPGEKRRGPTFYAPYLSDSDALDRAILDLTARLRTQPSDAGLRNDLGNLLARRGFAKEAADQYQKAAKLDHAFFLADYNEGLLWEKEGKSSAAIKAYERSIKRKPGFPLSRFHLGFQLEREGRNEDAVLEYAKALRIDPSLRWPARNPLVVQTRLLYRASLQNYERDLAGATLLTDADFADRAVWERLNPQRPVNTGEVDREMADEEAEPAAVSSGSPTSAPLIGGKAAAPAKPADARRQQLIDRFRRNRAGQPAPNPSQTVVAPVAPSVTVPPPPPPEDENAPNPAMQEPPPPVA